MVGLKLLNRSLDVYKDENISISSSMKDASDVSVVMADFTRQFSLPASKVNNKEFRHFYNSAVIGFDGRKKLRASMSVSGMRFREGLLQLDFVAMHNNIPTSYYCTFYSASVALTEVFGDLRLSDLSWNEYNHLQTGQQVYDGLNYASSSPLGSGNNDLIYPLATNSRYEWTAERLQLNPQVQQPEDPANPVDVPFSISPDEFRAAIKVKSILELIENQFSIELNSDLFESESFGKLYYWMTHSVDEDYRDLYSIAGENTPLPWTSTSGEFSDVLNPNGMIDFAVINEDVEYDDLVRWSTATAYLTVRPIQQDIPYVVSIYDFRYGGFILRKSATSVNGGDLVINETWEEDFRFVSYMAFRPLNPEDELTIDYQLEGLIKDKNEGQLGAFNSFTSSFEYANYGEEFRFRVSNISISEWLINLIRMNNLTIESSKEGVYQLDTWDTWRAKGRVIDLTDKIDIDESTVATLKMPSEINFKYKDPTAANNGRFTEVFGRSYGNLTSSTTSDGEAIDISVSIENLLWDRLPDTNYNVGKAVAYSKQAANNLDLSPLDEFECFIYWAGEEFGTIECLGFPQAVAAYKFCNSYIPLNPTTTSTFGLNFGAENNSYTTVPESASLFRNNYSTYLYLLTNQQARMTSFTAVIAPALLSDIQLNDTLRIDDRHYFINDFTAELGTRQVRFNLVNIVPTPAPYDKPAPPDPLRATVTGTTSLILQWGAAATAGRINVYKIFRDGVHDIYTIVGDPPGLGVGIGALPAGSTSQWYVVAVDSLGQESDPSIVVTVPLDGVVDPFFNEPITKTSTSDSYIDISWLAATEGASTVVNYQMILDGSVVATIPAADPRVYSFGPFQAAESHTVQIRVIAFDGSDDYSTIYTFETDADLTPPSDVTNLSSSAVSAYNASLIWDAATDEYGIAAYHIYDQDGAHVLSVGNVTSALVQYLNLDTSYTFKVKAEDVFGNLSVNFSNSVTVTTIDIVPPSTVTNLTVTDYSAYFISLAWDAATDNVGVVGYNIYRGDGGLFETVSNQTTAYLHPLTLGDTYTFKVKAIDSSGNLSTVFSNTVTQQTQDTTPPSTVTNMSNVFVGYDDAQLNWYPATDNVGVVGYNLYRGDGTLYETLGNITQHQLTGLAYDTAYSFKVKARDAAGNLSVGFSPTTSFTTKEFVFPPDVINLTFTELTYDTVRLNWDVEAPEPGQSVQDSFRIFTGDGSLLYSVNGSDIRTTIVNLPINGPEQTYKMKGYTIGGNESVNFSNTVSLTPPAFVYPTWNGVLTQESLESTTLTFSWLAATVGTLPLDRYEVRRFNIQYGTVAPNLLTFTDSGLVPEQFYRYIVRAVDTEGNTTAWSPELELFTPSQVPDWSANPNLSLDDVTDSSIEVSWTIPYAGSAPIDFYEVFVDNVLNRNTQNTFANVTGLDASTQYDIFVRATNLDDLSADSNTLTASTLEPQVVDVITKVSVGASTDCSYNGPWVNAYWSKTGGTSQDLPPQGTALFTDATYTTPFNGDTDVKVMQNTASFLKQIGVVTEGGIVQPVSPC